MNAMRKPPTKINFGSSNRSRQPAPNTAAGRANSEPNANRFDWPLCFDGETFLRERADAFLERNAFARRLSERMRDETGTDFFEWIDHVVLSPEDERRLRDCGFTRDQETETPD